MTMRRQQPTLETERLRLRPFLAEDAPAVQRLGSAREIVDGLISIPRPYSLDAAKAWIAGQVCSFRIGRSFHFAIERRESAGLIGAIELSDIDSEHAQAELRFWVGVRWWGRGYATEAAREIIRFAFESLSLNRIYTHYVARSPLAARLSRKLGMKKEGLLRGRARRWNGFEDVILYAVLTTDRATAQRPAKRRVASRRARIQP